MVDGPLLARREVSSISMAALERREAVSEMHWPDLGCADLCVIASSTMVTTSSPKWHLFTLT
jgi:hypothetical protein